MGISPADLDHRFTHHPPEAGKGQPARYRQLRAKARELAGLFVDLVPDSWELRVAVDQLDQAVMWANAAIARNE